MKLGLGVVDVALLRADPVPGVVVTHFDTLRATAVAEVAGVAATIALGAMLATGSATALMASSEDPRGTVNERCVLLAVLTFCTIMSTKTPASAIRRKTLPA